MRGIPQGLRVLAFCLFPAIGARAGDSITIREAIREALAKNPGFAARKLQIRLAATDVTSARLWPNPVLTVSADHLDVLGTGYDEENGAGPPEYASRLDLLMERGHKRDRRIALANATVDASRVQVAQDARELELDVAESGLDVMEAGIAARLARRTLELVGPDFLGPARFQATDLESARVAALLGRVQASLLQWEARHRRARRELQTWLGRPVTEEPPEIRGLPRRIANLPPLPQLCAEAKASRADLAVLRAELARSEINEGLQDALAVADPTVGSELRRQDGLAGVGNSMGVFVSIPLAWNERNEGERARARTETALLAARVAALERQVEGEVAALQAELEGELAVVREMEHDSLPHVPILESTTQDPGASLLDRADCLTSAYDLASSYIDARLQLARLIQELEAFIGRPLGPEVQEMDILSRMLEEPGTSVTAGSGASALADGFARTRIRGPRQAVRPGKKRPRVKRVPR